MSKKKYEKAVKAALHAGFPADVDPATAINLLSMRLAVAKDTISAQWQSSMKEVAWWLEGALKCEKWVWDADQFEAASMSLRDANLLIENAVSPVGWETNAEWKLEMDIFNLRFNVPDEESVATINELWKQYCMAADPWLRVNIPRQMDPTYNTEDPKFIEGWNAAREHMLKLNGMED